MAAALSKRAGARTIVSMIAAFLLVAMFAAGTAYASSPELVASDPEDGATNVACDGQLWLQFEKNVSAVVENADLVTLETADGEALPAENYTVVLPDPDEDAEHRQFIYIDVNGLQADTAYVIHIAPGIGSKSGDVNDGEMRIAFTTAASDAEAASASQPEGKAMGNQDGTGGGDGKGDGSGGGNDGKSAGSASAASASSGAASAGAASAGAQSSAAANASSSATSSSQGESEKMPVLSAAIIAICIIATLGVAVVAVRRSQSRK